MTDTRYKDVEWLHEQYHEHELTLQEIGDRCGVADNTVLTWMKKHDIERCGQGSMPSDKRYRDAEWLHEQYHEKELTQKEIANKCGVSQNTVRHWMNKYDIERRGQAEINRRIGLGTRSQRGYRVWYEGSLNKKVRVHRLLAVAEYGFDAVCDMDVHHQNGIKWDNRPDNIELMTPSEHACHHNLERHDDGDTRYKDAEWLHEQYHENELSQYEIAEKCDTHRSSIHRWMKKHGIERRDQTEHFHSDMPTGQLTLDDTPKLEGAQTVNQ